MPRGTDHLQILKMAFQATHRIKRTGVEVQLYCTHNDGGLIQLFDVHERSVFCEPSELEELAIGDVSF